MALLEVRNVTKRFHDGLQSVAVLDDISFDLYEGETVGVLASRRAGKTTLLRIAAGLDAPDAGVVLWRGDNLAASGGIRSLALRQGGIALARADRRMRDALTVLEYVATPLYSSGVGMKQAAKAARSALEMLEAAELGQAVTSSLCLAERARVELAKAIVRSPALLLVDEPAVLPQPKEAHALYALIHSLPRRLGLALLIASEDLTALRGVGRVLSLDRGRLYSTDSRHKVVSMSDRRAGRRGNRAEAS